MGVLNRTVEPSADVEGEIARYSLEEWWLSALSERERARVEEVYRHPGLLGNERPLTTGSGHSAFESATDLLIAMAGPLGQQAEDRKLASRILAHAEERATGAKDVLALHFTYEAIVGLQGRWRKEYADAADAAFAACYKQTRIAEQVVKAFRRRYPMRALPSHGGYELMVTMLMEEANYTQATWVCEKAKYEGWSGDWVGCLQDIAKASDYPVRYISRAGITQI